MATLKIVGLVGGLAFGPSPYDGEYVVEYDPGRNSKDPWGREMVCHLVTTPDPEKALELPSMEMFELWRLVDPRDPVRPDGKPNRPLTAFTVEMH